MRYFSLGQYLPYRMQKLLFGDRQQFGILAQEDDPDWQAWLKTYVQFYDSTQKQSVGKSVNDAGYKVLDWVDMADKRVLEIGPGNINHIKWWRGKPSQFVMADLSIELLSKSGEKLDKLPVDYASILVSRDNTGELPFKDATFDMIFTFYALEHLHPFAQHLNGMLRVLKPGGQLIGGIPTEGGIGWGLGRYLTSRRWLLKNTQIDPNKIICWEHPNFANFILQSLDEHPQLKRERLAMWPAGGPLIDANLIVKFLYRKRG